MQDETFLRLKHIGDNDLYNDSIILLLRVIVLSELLFYKHAHYCINWE